MIVNPPHVSYYNNMGLKSRTSPSDRTTTIYENRNINRRSLWPYGTLVPKQNLYIYSISDVKRKFSSLQFNQFMLAA